MTMSNTVDFNSNQTVYNADEIAVENSENIIVENSESPSRLKRIGNTVKKAGTAFINGSKRALKQANDTLTAGVNSTNDGFRIATETDHRFLSNVVALVTRPANFIQSRAGYVQGTKVLETSPENLKLYQKNPESKELKLTNTPARFAKSETDKELTGPQGYIVRAIAFNDRVASRVSDIINACTNNVLGSVGMVIGSVLGAVARVGIFLGLAAAETVVGLAAAALLVAVIVAAAVPAILTAPIWTGPLALYKQSKENKKADQRDEIIANLQTKNAALTEQLNKANRTTYDSYENLSESESN